MKNVIGIDLGGTKINSGIVDENGKILKKLDIKTESKSGRKEVLDGISYLIMELMKRYDVEAIGIGSPGSIDINTGIVSSLGANISGWTGTNIKGELEREFYPLNVFVENDANVATMCEQWLGAGKGLDSFVMITLGTGVGGGIWTSKEGIWHGSHFKGTELGHTILYPMGRKCNCGQRGCVEKYISGVAVENMYYGNTSKKLSGAEIFKNCKVDPICGKIVDDFTTNLSIFLITLKNIFDPDGIVIGGGVINSKQFWWNEVLEKFHANCNESSDIKILPAKYLNDAGLIGAAKVAFDYIEK